MSQAPINTNQTRTVSNFEDLVGTPFQGENNAICWKRELVGDFSEIVDKLEASENVLVITPEMLNKLDLTEQGLLAREILLSDLNTLKAHGASPVLNLIKCYDRDESFFPTDVYSFHVDRSPIPTATFLCTYHGTSSEIIPNSEATQKVLIPEIRAELKALHDGPDASFEAFLTEYFFDLHYQPKPNAQAFGLGIGNLWKLAVDHPESPVLPCLHRAPEEKDGQSRLLLIC